MFCRKKPSTNKYTSKFTANFKISKNFLKPLEVLSGVFFFGGGGEGEGSGSILGIVLVWVVGLGFFHKRERKTTQDCFTLKICY